MSRVVTSPDDIPDALLDAPGRGPCSRVLMGSPAHFTVESAINPWMKDDAGNLNRVDPARALEQWNALAEAYTRAGIKVEVIEAAPGMPDFCFSANQSLAFQHEDAGLAVLLSRMASDTRVAEVPHFERWYRNHGFKVFETPEDLRPFEGTGDAIRHHGQHAYWGGVGPRTRMEAWYHVARITGAVVIPLTLRDERYYHLDTCLCVLSTRAALYIPGAFDDESEQRLEAGFEDLIPISTADAENFACNAHCPDDKHVFIQKGSEATVHSLKRRGFEVIELDTSEFMKSGGSVFCLKQELP
jgi:N-dimethylarginine dimethylaminohydrolase